MMMREIPIQMMEQWRKRIQRRRRIARTMNLNLRKTKRSRRPPTKSERITPRGAAAAASVPKRPSSSHGNNLTNIATPTKRRGCLSYVCQICHRGLKNASCSICQPTCSRYVLLHLDLLNTSRGLSREAAMPPHRRPTTASPPSSPSTASSSSCSTTNSNTLNSTTRSTPSSILACSTPSIVPDSCDCFRKRCSPTPCCRPTSSDRTARSSVDWH
mmetsp:Transcript_40753/g.85358  ORF Transcript_40753/g.85358 Transcript_40753/m.85358 type:complete len:215 (+) Transcript_40753:401-1045(+)